jgi:hypothetical protein
MVSWQCHAPTALCPWERTPGTHWTGGWVDPRAGLDTEARGKILFLCLKSHEESNDGRTELERNTDERREGCAGIKG